MSSRYNLKRAAAFLTGSVLLVLVVVAGSVPLAKPIGDPDFFWHLKTGGWIWEHKSLPHEFLFSLTAPEGLNDARRFTMTSYWTVQVLYHLLHATWGMTGIAVLRVVLQLLIVGSLFLRKKGKDPLVFLATTFLVVVLTRTYFYERPQIFSFVFFSFLLLLLDGMRASSSTVTRLRLAAFALPFLMLLWANSHGGFVLGQFTILLYLFCEGVKYAHPALGPLPWSRYRILLLSGGAGLAAAFLNPNTWHPLFLTQLPRWLTATNVEYLSSLQYFLQERRSTVLLFWLVLALAALCLVLSGRSDITRAALVVTIAVMSWKHVRHTLFLPLAAAPLIEGTFSGERLRRIGGRVVVLLAVAIGLALFRKDLASLQRFPESTTVNRRYPAEAANFIEKSGLQGNLYSVPEWGGYVLWRLYPTRVFNDGRNSDQEVDRLDRVILAGKTDPRVNGLPHWKSIFADYDIRCVLVPIVRPWTGEYLPLVIALLRDPSWVPVWGGYNSFVFVQPGRGNDGVILRSAIPREKFLERLISSSNSLVRLSPRDAQTRLAQGDLLLAVGRVPEALRAYEEALRLAPASPVAAAKIRRLKNGVEHPGEAQ